MGQTTEYYWYDNRLSGEVRGDGSVRIYVYTGTIALGLIPKTRRHLISIDGQLFDPSSEHFSFDCYHMIDDMKELANLRAFMNLKSASFYGSGLDDVGLRYVSDVPTIENLNLQNTRISNEGLSVLERLPNLKYLRLKENAQLSNECIPHLLKLKQLVDLQIHETSIDQYGVNQLVVMDTLRDICLDVWKDNYSFDVTVLGLDTNEGYAKVQHQYKLAKKKGGSGFPIAPDDITARKADCGG